MIHERIYLDPENPDVFIDTYIADRRNRAYDAMLVLPGGGYTGVCSGKEGEPIALAYLGEGFNTFVLNYRVSTPYPAQLIDASRAIMHIRENAEKYCIDPNRVFAIGFSAGGHLAGTLATNAADPEVRAVLGISGEENRPNGVVLAYPVVSAFVPTHEGSFRVLAGKPFDEITEEEKKKLSLECNVDKSSAPAFIWHTYGDTTVPPYGSLLLAAEYVRVGVNASMHLYPYGPHGIAFGTELTAAAPGHVQPLATGWFADSVKWLKSL